MLGGSGPSGGLGAGTSGWLGVSSSINGINGVGGTSGNGTAAEASAYPLVTTVEFLREFGMDDDRSKDLKEKGKANANANAKVNGEVASGSGSGSSSRISNSRGGKGKERERERGDSMNDASRGSAVGRDGGTELFLPRYVYDAMKVRKRFEHMRVSFPLVSSSFHSPVVPSSFPFLYVGDDVDP